ncbi:MAG: class I SAM-dependent methyltransferase [Gaiellales bacterium]
MSWSEHAERNRAVWDTWSTEYAAPGRESWAQSEPTWGIYAIPESEVGILPDVAGLDVIELGCGTAYWSAWLARRGARPVGLDASQGQLATAAAMQEEHDLHFPLVHGSAEATGFPDESFDLAFSEYGACIWCDPYAWVPEAARLLRPGGRLIMLCNSTLSMLCVPPDGSQSVTELQRDAFGMHRFDWDDDGSTEFHLAHGEWIALFRANGLWVEMLAELQAPEGAQSTHDHVSVEWARRWPAEEIWRLRKEG